jgi:hypothetical protein
MVVFAAPTQVTALLTEFFGPYKSIGKVRELSVTFEAAKKELFQHAFTDFRQHVQHRNEASEAALSDACLALDAFGDAQTARNELMAWFTKLQVRTFTLSHSHSFTHSFTLTLTCMICAHFYRELNLLNNKFLVLQRINVFLEYSLHSAARSARWRGIAPRSRPGRRVPRQRSIRHAIHSASY